MLAELVGIICALFLIGSSQQGKLGQPCGNDNVGKCEVMRSGSFKVSDPVCLNKHCCGLPRDGCGKSSHCCYGKEGPGKGSSTCVNKQCSFCVLPGKVYEDVDDTEYECCVASDKLIILQASTNYVQIACPMKSLHEPCPSAEGKNLAFVCKSGKCSKDGLCQQ